MSKLLDLYEKSDFSSLPNKRADKTPLEADGGRDLSKDEKALAQARGGKLQEKKYSDITNRE
jgi:hypothetical protein